MEGKKQLSKNIMNMKFMKKTEKKEIKQEDKTFSWYAQYYFNRLNANMK